MGHSESDDEGRSADAANRPATFDDIVASWLADGSVPRWPDEQPPREVPACRAAPPPPVAEEHFVPPDPPPLPHLGPRAIVGLALLVVGIILAATPQVVGLDEPAGLALGLLSLALGLGWLVLGSWPSDSDEGEDEDDGAVL